jgi:hypothetical protein
MSLVYKSVPIFESTDTMNVPNFPQAFIDEPKLRDYLLSPTHPQGASKSTFFGKSWIRTLGYCGSARGFAVYYRQFRCEQFPRNSVVDGLLPVPNAYDALVRTVWIIEKGKTAPRFITMHPL